VFNTLYIWMSAHHSFLVSSFADFLNFCSYFSSDYGLSCILPMY